MKTIWLLAPPLAILLATAPGCFKNNRSPAEINEDGDAGAFGGAGNRIVLSSLLLSGTNGDRVTLFLNASTSGIAANSVCDGAGKPCKCAFSWTETNSGNSIPRAISDVVESSTPYAVKCVTPAEFTNIPNGTSVQATLTSTVSSFAVTPYVFVKSATTGQPSGNFIDYQGRAFHNILRYSCYEQYQRGMSVRSRVLITSNPTTGQSITLPFASKFCVQKASGGSTTNPNECPGDSSVDYSAQAYYYNLFIRDGEKGGINASNDRYSCPRVIETLGFAGTTATQNNYYPLDSQFALMLAPSSEFPLGVEANTKISKSNDPTSLNTSCSGTQPGSNPGNASLIQSCLGFAARANTDGTCPTYTDSNGAPQPTFRLRRYVAMYPPLYDSDGTRLPRTQSTDTIYVVDRPVTGGSADPLAPYTMRGPKPCPFAFFDRKGVTGYSYVDAADTTDPAYAASNGFTPTYMGTSSSRWSGKNVDGIQFPNRDSPQSCSAALPILNGDKTIMSIATVSNVATAPMRELHIRPIRPFGPHYEEDTDFKACAPLASVFKDPPLHFAKTSAASGGNVAYCAEAYPSRNPNVAALDARSNPAVPNSNYIGKVRNFTSHAVKNSVSATCDTRPAVVSPPAFPANYPAAVPDACADTGPPGALPWAGSGLRPSALPRSTALVEGYARQPDGLYIDFDSDNTTAGATAWLCANQACNRTVIPSTGAGWTRYPLLADPADVEDALVADDTYQCQVSYDDGTKMNLSTPTGGCCGAATDVVTGAVGMTNPDHPRAAHLEPGINGTSTCASPAY